MYKQYLGIVCPLVVIDDNNISLPAKCYFINKTLDGFDSYDDKILCKRVEVIGEYSVTKWKHSRNQMFLQMIRKNIVCLMETRNL